MTYYNLYNYKKWTFLILATKNGLKELTLYYDEDLSNYKFDKEITKPYYELLDNYFKRKKVGNFNLDINGTSFQMNVWHELIKVNFGSKTTYETLGIKINRPKSARAIGNAVGMNPILILIPCHRVLRKDGTIGGFSSDPKLKIELLKHEGII